MLVSAFPIDSDGDDCLKEVVWLLVLSRFLLYNYFVFLLKNKINLFANYFLIRLIFLMTQAGRQPDNLRTPAGANRSIELFIHFRVIKQSVTSNLFLSVLFS